MPLKNTSLLLGWLPLVIGPTKLSLGMSKASSFLSDFLVLERVSGVDLVLMVEGVREVIQVSESLLQQFMLENPNSGMDYISSTIIGSSLSMSKY